MGSERRCVNLFGEQVQMFGGGQIANKNVFGCPDLDA